MMRMIMINILMGQMMMMTMMRIAASRLKPLSWRAHAQSQANNLPTLFRFFNDKDDDDNHVGNDLD